MHNWSWLIIAGPITTLWILPRLITFLIKAISKRHKAVAPETNECEQDNLKERVRLWCAIDSSYLGQ